MKSEADKKLDALYKDYCEGRLSRAEWRRETQRVIETLRCYICGEERCNEERHEKGS